jgi:hypothetical protein
MNLIGSINISGTSSGGTLSSIPQTFNNLYILGTSRQDNASTGASIIIRFNGDSGSNYEYRAIEAYGTIAYTQNVTSTSNTYGWLASGAAANSGTSVWSSLSAIVGGYSRTNIYKPVMCFSAHLTTSSSNAQHNWSYSEWKNTNAITSIDIVAGSGQFIAGTKFDIYGI